MVVARRHRRDTLTCIEGARLAGPVDGSSIDVSGTGGQVRPLSRPSRNGRDGVRIEGSFVDEPLRCRHELTGDIRSGASAE